MRREPKRHQVSLSRASRRASGGRLVINEDMLSEDLPSALKMKGSLQSYIRLPEHARTASAMTILVRSMSIIPWPI